MKLSLTRFTRRPVMRNAFIFFASLMLLAMATFALREVSADAFSHWGSAFGINEQSRVGKLIKQVNQHANLAAGKNAVLAVFFATRTVTNGNDSGAGSLRDAIAAASSGDTIVFSGVTTVGLTSGELVINKNLTITGPGANQLTVERSEACSTANSRVFNISSGSTLAISGMTISRGFGDEGGAIRNAGTLTITDCALTGNQSKGTDAGGAAGKTGGGGAIFNDSTGTLTITRTTISGNKAVGGDGGTGNGEGGGGGGLGGGIFNNGGSVTVTNSTLSGNRALGGIGRYTNQSCPTGAVGKGGGRGGEDSIAASFGGGGGGTQSGGRFGGGGGAKASFSSPGSGGFLGGSGAPFTVGCSDGEGGDGGAAGGAVFNNGGTFKLVNVTIVNNNAQGGDHGSNYIPAPGSSRAGGIYNEAGTLTLQNSIVAGNSAQEGSYADCDSNSNPITTNGNNLFGSGTGCPTGGAGDLTTTNVFASLGPLTNNGGPTLTHALLSGSPAINAGNNSVTGAPYNLSTDQRGTGFARNVNGTVDIGAYETSEPASNHAPTISSVTLMRTAGAGSSNSTIANVGDADQAANTLTVKVNGATSTTLNGVTVSNLVVSSGGVVTADVMAQADAGSADFSLTVTDNQAITVKATLLVIVAPQVCGGGNSAVWSQQAQNLASDGAANDRLGVSVAISGNTAIVGASLNDAAGTDAGAAYVFTRSGTTWTQQQKLTPPAGECLTSINFGSSVAISGDTAIVGAIKANTPLVDSAGAAYVFTRSGSVWTLQQKLTAADPQTNVNFGTSAAISGDTILVGATRSGGTVAGDVYVFTRNGSTWAQQQKLNNQFSVNFGISVAINGDTAIIGASLETLLANRQGAAHIFTRNGTTWSEQTVLYASDAATTDNFGTSVAISGDTAVVGAPLADLAAGTNAGKVYVYRRSGATWTEQQKLTASDAAGSANFGKSSALSGDTAMIGSANGAYVFTRSGANWTQQQKLTPQSGATGINFGGAVAFSGNTFIVGASLDDPAAGADAGSSYIYTLNCPNTAPSITAQTGVTRQQGSPVSNSTIATVSDAETAAGSLTVTVTSANPSNGVTLSNIVNTNGTITADIVANCTATNASFTLQVSDGSLTATATLNVTVTANTAPTLTYAANASVTAGNALTVNPATGLTDNGSISTIAVQSATPSTSPATITVNNTTGVVTVPNNVPAGTYTVTIRATDNCGATTDAPFTLTVNPPAPTLGNYSATTMNLGAQSTVTPSAAPAYTTSLQVKASSGFQGTFYANPATGVVKIVNANPAGTHTVTVAAFGTGGSTSKTFTLTVQSGTACSGAPRFSSGANVSAGSPFGVTVGDFNNDGKQDLAIANQSNATVSIRLGDGAGGFTGTTSVATGTMPSRIAVGDFNGDGNQDLAVASGGVTILLGDGTGNFTGTPNSSGTVSDIAVGDFNNDGKLDLIYPNAGGANTVSVRLGDGAGGFGSAINTSVGAGPQTIAIGDFNGDGKLDFASDNYTASTISIRLGDGAGNFSSAADVATGTQVSNVTLGDFNKDGKLDLAIANGGSSNVFVRLGDGLGGFTGSTNLSANGAPKSVIAGDFNNDGNPDLAVLAGTGIDYWLGDGAGGFGARASLAGAGNTTVLTLGDFNQDGWQDFANGYFSGGVVSIWLGSCNTAPSFTPAVAVTRTQGTSTSNITLGTVSDAETAVGSLTVTQIAGGTATGITASGITNTNGTITATLNVACTAIGGTVRLQVSDGQLTGTGDFQVNVNAAPIPVINTPPQPQTVCVGNSATFSVSASSTTSYQWRKNGNNISGATSNSYTIASTSAADAGNYDVVLTAFCGGTTTSNAVALTVNPTTAITTPPASQTKTVGQSATFSVAATGTNLTYQWRKGGTNINGANSSSYTIASVTTGDAGNYDVVVTGSCGNQTSTAATLTVDCITSLTVNDTGDGADASPGNGVCETAPGNGICTLRAAIQEANALTACSPMTINFSVTGTITLASALTGINHPNLTINGPGADQLTVSGNNAVRVFTINPGSLNVTLSGLTVANGNVSNAGSGLSNLNTGTTTITNCVFANNASGSGAFGGGIYHFNAGTLNVTGTTFNGNSAGGGGGLYNNAAGTVNITNCTFSGNTAAFGSAINSGGSSGTINLLNTTITGNTANGAGGGGSIRRTSGTVNLKNTLVAGNTATTNPDVDGTFISQGNNLIGNTTGGTGFGGTDLLNVSALVGALGNYGGTTSTIPLLPGSPAINAGTSTGAPASDQRGIARVGNVDIGAFESRGFTLTVAGGNSQSATTGSTFALPLSVTVASSNSEPVNGGRVTFTPPGSGASCTFATNPATISAGAASSTVTANATIGGPYTVSAAANGATTVNFSLTNTNNAPTITAGGPLTRQAGSAGSNSPIATVSDTETAAGSLTVTAITVPTGITVTGITNTSGTVTATVNAACNATVGANTVVLTVSDGNGAAATANLTVNVTAAATPSITAQPANQTVCAGSTATFSVTAGNAVSYQWQKNGVNISGATSATYTTPATVAGDNGALFSVVINGACGTPVTSSNATLTVNNAVAITTQPQDSTVCVGATASFSVTATGAGLTYQWQKNGVNISGATGATYTTPATVAADNGALYSVVVSGTCGTPVTSGNAALIVNPATAITTPPDAQTVCAGSTATFSVAATGASLTYQWRKGGVNISGATSATYTTPATTAGDNGALFSVVVIGACGTPVTSSNATLTVNNAASITTQPQNSTVCVGATASFSVTATGAGLTYQWQKNGVNISGATAASYTTPVTVAGDNGALYSVIVSGTCSTPVTSSNATLTVNNVAAITTQPQSATVCAGATASFSVAAMGAGLTYQWRKNGVDISGANSSSYTTPATVAGDNGAGYTVVVTGACGAPVTSSSATLTVSAAPAITTQPVNQTVCAGSTATFSVAATGAGLAYQWQKNGTNISGATASSYSTPATTTADNGAVYTVIVSGACGTPVTSSNATLTVNAAPAISTQPVNQTVCAGSTATFSVAATGAGLTYQWQKNGTNISGATASSYTTPATTTADNGALYTVIVSGACGTPVTSSNATLTVNAAPAITTQPANQTVCAGSTATFSVAATGAGLTYQWQKNGTNISGATAASYTTPATTTADNGAVYTVIVSGACGTPVTSSSATLTVNAALAITTQPANQTVCAGSTATFSVAATGAGLTYQWQKNGTNISGATASSYTTPATTTADNGALYTVIVSGACGMPVTSSNATLTVNATTAITTQPQTQTICAGTTATFSVAATGVNLSYQWHKGGVNIAGATASSYSIASAAAGDVANYDVVVTGTCGTVTSSVAALTVNPATAITTQPASLNRTTGQSATFSVVATGLSLTYQWRKNGNNISGATSASYTIASVAPGDAGNYSVVVTGTCGAVTSNTAVLNVDCVVVTVGPPTLPGGTTGIAYNQQITASPTGSYAFTVSSGAMPTGLSLNSSTGAITGTPSAAGTFNFSITATDANNCSGAQGYTVVICAPAAITTQPQAQTVCAGSPATFSVAATGSGLSYQWRKNGANIAGATSNTYSIATATAADAATYSVIVSGACGTPVTSGNATLTVNPTTAITQQPVNQATCLNGPVTFTIAATGANLAYQWRKGGANIAGATASSLTIANVTAADAASYDVVVSGACGAQTSSVATLSINAGTSINAQPQPQTVCPGGAATFTVAASGSGTLTYQWRKNGANIAGATASSLTIASVAATDAAGYDVVVSSDCGTATSNAATLTVNPATAITTQPANQTVCAGSPVNFSVTATGTNLTYQWRKNGTNIAGATAATFSIASPTAADAAGYDVEVTGACGAVTSNTASLTVNATTAIIAQPTSQTKTVGQSVSFSITAAGTNLTYQWRKNTVNISGATSATYTIASVVQADAASYDVIVTGTCGTATSNAATLTVNCPTITLNPATLPSATTGTNYSQTITATGGAAPYSFTVTTGNLPAGLTLTTAGSLSGTPAASGSFTFTVRATDANNCFGERQYTIGTDCATVTVTPATPSLPGGMAGTPYSQAFTASGGAAPYVLILSAGTLPTGLSLINGALTGTPTGFGNFSFTVKATDNNGCFGERAYTLRICAIITVAPTTLPAMTVGVAYNQTITASGGASPYSFAASGTLPPGVTLASDGTLSGTPTQSGSFSFTVTATDALGCTGSQSYTLGGSCQTVTVNPASLVNGFVGTSYSQSLSATGGTAPYAFTVSTGKLPGGLALGATGALTGTPTASGSFTFTVRATDANGCFGERGYSVLISGAGLMFYPLPQPVRLLETRAGFGGCNTPGAPIAANSTFTLPARTTCAGIPANAQAVIGNVTVVPSGAGYLTLFPSNAAQPTVANSNFAAGEITNNVFTVGLGSADGAFKLFSSATTEVIIDVTGYYAPPGASGLYFHPLSTPVRLLETRAGLNGCIAPGTPLTGTGDPNADPNADLSLQGRSPVASPCNSIPAAAQVLVGNATSVLPSGGGYLTIYPSGGARPTVASSNYAGTDVINGPFTVKLGADGKFKIYTFATTNLVVDILGYYSADATDANGAGLLFTPLPAPVRLLETRSDFPGFPLSGCTRTNAPIQGNLSQATHTQSGRSFCGLPASAQALAGNVTVVNAGGAGFLTLFPGNLTTAPLVATSNYPAPATFGYNRHYLVGLSPADGTFKALTQFTTDLILDVAGYFAP